MGASSRYVCHQGIAHDGGTDGCLITCPPLDSQSPLTSSSPLVRPFVAPIKPAVEEKKPAVAQAAAGSGATPEPAPKKFLGFEALTWAKIIPLGCMFFCILFNYTILRDTKVRLGCGCGWHVTNACIACLVP